MYDILQLNDMLVPELRELAESLGVDGFKKLNKQELVYTILYHQALKGKKKEAGSNGSGTADLPDEVPVSSDNMRVDKRQPGAPLKRSRKPANSKETEEAVEETIDTSSKEVTSEVTPVAEPKSNDRQQQQHRRPEHRLRADREQCANCSRYQRNCRTRRESCNQRRRSDCDTRNEREPQHCATSSSAKPCRHCDDEG